MSYGWSWNLPQGPERYEMVGLQKMLSQQLERDVLYGNPSNGELMAAIKDIAFRLDEMSKSKTRRHRGKKRGPRRTRRTRS